MRIYSDYCSEIHEIKNWKKTSIGNFERALLFFEFIMDAIVWMNPWCNIYNF